MKLQHIELNQLKLSKNNVRRHGGKDVADLVASIRSLGVIQPLLVRPNCEGFEVVAGQRRLRACQAIAEEAGHFDPVPCAVLETDDDAKVIEASLAENVARLPMDEVDQYRAFAALKAKGRTIEEIASGFGVTELLVRKRLAIASLIPPILTAYRKDEIDAATLRVLTMATRAQQKEWLKLLRDPDGYAPRGSRLKAWLFGGDEIPVVNALFPVEDYPGSIVSDLFGDERYFDDANAFWKLQLEAVIHRQAAYLEAGWSDVIILQTGEHFFTWDKVKRPKKRGGKVYISCAHNGEVEFHEGWLEEKEAARLAKADAGADDDDKPVATERPELTKTAIRYVELHRHNAVRAELLKIPQVAFRLMAASIIATGGLWHVDAEGQSAGRNEAIADSVAASKAQAAIEAERRAVRELLGIEDADGSLIRPLWEAPDRSALFARLLALTDDEVLRVLTFVMAETLEAGTPEVEALGAHLDVDMATWWSPDDAFFDLLRDKAAINSMVAEVAGVKVAAANLMAPAKVQKGIVRDCLDGTNGRAKVDAWLPRYMRFPMEGYTKRKGLPAIEQWKAIRKLFDRRA